MKALSIRQPFAWAILCAGKRVENRDWAKARGHVTEAQRLIDSGDRFLIHASAAFEHRGQHFLRQLAEWNLLPDGVRIPDLRGYRQGGFIGSAVLIGLIHASDEVYDDARLVEARNSHWFFGPYGLVLDDVAPMAFVPARGMLGFFEVPADLGREGREVSAA